MKNLAKKVAVAVSTGALVVQSLVLPAFATVTVIVSGNGSDTENTVGVEKTNTTTVTQTNTANVSNNVDANASTGGNEASDNTGGPVSVKTGNAESDVTVENTVNSNEAQVGCSGCPADLGVEISGNGTDSDNSVGVGLVNTTWVTQTNTANVSNNVDAKASTGHNEAEDNTGGNVDVHTGWAKATADVKTEANANVAQVGPGGEGALDLIIKGNGSETENSIGAELSNTIGVTQDNFANIANDVEVKAETGWNDVEDNTGGTSGVHTGSALAGATVDTMANFNMANVEDCCELDGLVKVAGNGTDSDSSVELGLVTGTYATQTNDYGCEEPKYGLFSFPWEQNGDGCNNVEAKAKTGYNDVEDNTGNPGVDPSVKTGDAATDVVVKDTGNSNVFSTGDALPSPSPLPEMGENMNWFLWLLHGWGVVS